MTSPARANSLPLYLGNQPRGHWRLCFLKIVQNLKQFWRNMNFFHFICTNMWPNVLVAESPVFPWPCPVSLLNQFFTAVVRSTIYPCLRLLIMIKFSSFLAWVSIIWQKKGKYWVLKNRTLSIICALKARLCMPTLHSSRRHGSCSFQNHVDFKLKFKGKLNEVDG